MAKSKLSPAPKKTAPKQKTVVKASRATMIGCDGPSSTERNVEVRKIDNGYIVRESTYGPKGYKSSERFSEKAPTIEIEPSKPRK